MAEPTARRRRILFVAEAVSLAHVARPFALASVLPSPQYDIHFAWDPRYAHLFAQPPGTLHRLHSISTDRFLSALESGRPIYDSRTLHDYVRDDLRLLEAVQPELVVGDFRLSLAVSAPVFGVPYIALTNAYWSPYLPQRFPVPDLPVVRWFGLALGQAVFDAVRPLAFAYHAIALNRTRRAYGLPSVGFDLRSAYTFADYTLYADIPGLYPPFDYPPNHRFLGAVFWSPSVRMPDWWSALEDDRPLVYVNLGSSGRFDRFAQIMRALAPLPVRVVAATAGRALPPRLPDNVFCAPYLPGDRVAERAALVVCNGGSPAAQQALRAGVPVLGLPGNMDQYLNMGYVERAGAGTTLRPTGAEASGIRSTVEDMLECGSLRENALKLSRQLKAMSSAQRFGDLLSEI